MRKALASLVIFAAGAATAIAATYAYESTTDGDDGQPATVRAFRGSQTVLVWPLARGPDGPPFTYEWQP